MGSNMKSVWALTIVLGLWGCETTESSDGPDSPEQESVTKSSVQHQAEPETSEVDVSDCERAVRHIYAFTEATAVGVSDAELAIMTKVVMGATELCERDGLTPEVQACVMAVRTYRGLWDLPACQGMPELAPAWLREIGGPGPSQPYPAWVDSTPEEMRARMTGGAD